MIDKKQLIEELLECVKDATDTETQITGLSMCATLINEVLDEELTIQKCDIMKQIELTSQEQSIIENALSAYWNDAHTQLDNNKFTNHFMLDGTKRPLGDIERQQLEQRKELTFPILKRFENLY